MGLSNSPARKAGVARTTASACDDMVIAGGNLPALSVGAKLQLSAAQFNRTLSSGRRCGERVDEFLHAAGEGDE